MAWQKSAKTLSSRCNYTTRLGSTISPKASCSVQQFVAFFQSQSFPSVVVRFFAVPNFFPIEWTVLCLRN